MAWLPDRFAHPTYVEIGSDLHLRPISPLDTDLDMVAVMGSRDRLWSMFGEIWGWPPADMTHEQDREDLQHHADEMERHESFNYALFDPDETALMGCVYIDPTDKPGADADVAWWVVDELAGTAVESRLDTFVPAWVEASWPFVSPRFVGRDLTYAQWAALPRVGGTP